MKKTPEEKKYAVKAARLWKFYRVTPEENAEVEEYERSTPAYSILLERGNPDDTSPALIFTDHDHDTGMIRGRLAYLINKALGIIESSYKERTHLVMRALADYLENPPAVRILGPRFGIIGRAKKKKSMVYGSIDGPLPPEKTMKKKKGKSK